MAETGRRRRSGRGLIAAALAGVFTHGPGPGGPGRTPRAEPGDFVLNGQQLGLVDQIMTQSPVLADTSGTLLAYHAEDGEIVEFGQLLVTVDPQP